MERDDSEGLNTGGEETTSASEIDRGLSSRVKSVASTVKEKASGIPALLADGLQAGAQALRQRTGSTEVSAGGSSVAVTSDPSITAVTDTLATGMQSSADWLRDADLEKLKDGVEKQVKEHPARSLLVALGAGYLIGKALRR
ncbi:MAG: hypothetical protein M3P12_05020 [Gemmatimonadota bacterium]|nr:hypothetical protein [Gemmatimonadota bacterium]